MHPGRTPIVVLGDDWGRHVSTLQHLFRRIIGRYPLVWVNSFGHRRPRLTLYDMQRAAHKLVALAQPSTPRTDNPREPLPDFLVHPVALPWHDMAAVRRFNCWSLARDIRRGVAKVAPGERPLFVSGTPTAFGLIGLLDELAAIYFCIDDYGEIHGTDRDLLAPLEVEMLARVDAVVATAASLTVTKRPASGRTLQLPQGVNFEHFARARPIPADVVALPRPIFGFAGGVGPAVDFTLVRALASAFPNGSVVMVGPHQQDVSVEQWPANIHFVGPRPYSELPAYVQAFTVGLVPYVHSDWTRAVDPLKLLEYLAAGIPVVTTALPEAKKYASAVHIANGPGPFVEAVRAAIATDGPDARALRQEVAAGNRWEDRADAFLAYAESVVVDRIARHG
jgi:hypothetical protein